MRLKEKLRRQEGDAKDPAYRFVDKFTGCNTEDTFFIYERASLIEIYGSVEAAQISFAAHRAARGRESSQHWERGHGLPTPSRPGEGKGNVVTGRRPLHA